MMGSCDKKLVRSKSGLKIVATNQNLTSPFMIEEPQWIPDNECPKCMNCDSKFDFLKRRHHCRRCGQCFCNECCMAKIALPRMCFVDPVRQCIKCTEASMKESEFFDKHLKTLQAGSNFHVNSSCLPQVDDNTSMSFMCKMSNDHRFLLFETLDNTSPEHMPLEMMQIESSRILATDLLSSGNKVATKLHLSYQDCDRTAHSIQMMCPEDQKRPSMLWLSAMQKALKMMSGGRQPLSRVSSLSEQN